MDDTEELEDFLNWCLQESRKAKLEPSEDDVVDLTNPE